MIAAPRQQRRRFLVVLSAALVIATGAVMLWAGWNVYRVGERRATLQWIERQGGIVQPYADESVQQLRGGEPEWYLEKRSQISRVRLWFGDKAIYYVGLVHTSATWADRERVAYLFPEACVVPERPNGFHPRSESDRSPGMK